MRRERDNDLIPLTHRYDKHRASLLSRSKEIEWEGRGGGERFEPRVDNRRGSEPWMNVAWMPDPRGHDCPSRVSTLWNVMEKHYSRWIVVIRRLSLTRPPLVEIVRTTRPFLIPRSLVYVPVDAVHPPRLHVSNGDTAVTYYPPLLGWL